jgi:hypothetical protein
MLGNDKWGDCVFAGMGHVVELETYYGQGSETVVSDQQALQAYSAATGFDPDAGPSGENPTDQGYTVQGGLEYLQKTGMAGKNVTAFASVDVSSYTQVETAVANFGVIALGIQVPSSAQQQFAEHKPWAYVPGSEIEGGHCILMTGYDNKYYSCITWGAVQEMERSFWENYVEEAWVPVDKDWVSLVKGTDPEGVDLKALGEQYAQLTGQSNPF